MKAFAKLGDLPAFQALAIKFRRETEFSRAVKARKVAHVVYRPSFRKAS